MKAFNRAVDRFCARHPRFGIPNLMLFIIIGTAVVFLFGKMDTTGYFMSYLTFSPAMIARGQVWRLVTFLFIPQESNIFFEALWLYFYNFIGSSLENRWGSGRFTVFFFTGALLTMLYSLLAGIITNVYFFPASAHYIYLSMFLAFASLYPEQQVLLFFFIPIKVKWIAIVDVVYLLYCVVSISFPFNLLPLVAIFNCLLFCYEYLAAAFRPVRNAASPRVIHFKSEKKKIEREEKHRDETYRRKCSVCGRTDVSNPELDFRYCSRCAGYHCFCQDHINSHVHFTE